jgi:hypothetical protein
MALGLFRFLAMQSTVKDTGGYLFSRESALQPAYGESEEGDNLLVWFVAQTLHAVLVSFILAADSAMVCLSSWFAANSVRLHEF